MKTKADKNLAYVMLLLMSMIGIWQTQDYDLNGLKIIQGDVLNAVTDVSGRDVHWVVELKENPDVRYRFRLPTAALKNTDVSMLSQGQHSMVVWLENDDVSKGNLDILQLKLGNQMIVSIDKTNELQRNLRWFIVLVAVMSIGMLIRNFIKSRRIP